MNSPYGTFNRSLKNFFRELDRSLPNNVVFTIMLAGYKVLKTVNKTLPHKYFHEHLNEPHGHCLRNRDDSSLFDDCYVPPMLFSNVINSLKMIWKSTNTETKDTIWLHIQVLMQLNDCCLEYKKNKGDTASDDS